MTMTFYFEVCGSLPEAREIWRCSYPSLRFFSQPLKPILPGEEYQLGSNSIGLAAPSSCPFRLSALALFTHVFESWPNLRQTPGSLAAGQVQGVSLSLAGLANSAWPVHPPSRDHLLHPSVLVSPFYELGMVRQRGLYCGGTAECRTTPCASYR
jgi:hypothetical protein